jgi:hypothetical protein
MRLIALAHILIGIGFASHAITTGRPHYWIYIIMLLPGVGSLAYVLFELLPDLAYTRRGRAVVGGIDDIVDPNREWRRRFEEAQRTDSVDTKLALAEECERKAMWAEAISLYETAAKGVFAEDQAVLFGLARAQLGAGDAKLAEATLDRLRAAHPDLQHQEAHLLYARTLEEQGRLDEAKDEYEALAGYYVGLEARTRYGLLLLKTGSPEKAHAMFDSVMRASKTRGIVLTDNDCKWLKTAKANLT